MARKYLSFLGTTRYVECFYVLPNHNPVRCHFVQEALTGMLCQKWTSDDQIVIFTTHDATLRNWQSSEEWIGLDERLHTLALPCPHRQGPIPDGDSEDALWEIFDIVFQNLHDGDDIIFDITHAFRSLPMLALIILNYARFIKQCTLTGIYYGAFESLGPSHKVKELPIEERQAPIFDLTPFASLLDWTVGIDRFVNTGDASVISTLTSQNITPILKETQGQDTHANQLRQMANAIDMFAQNTATCRGKELSRSAVNVQRNITEAILSSAALVKPLTPLLNRMEDRFQGYDSAHELRNAFEVARWCQDHQLIQQGLTILQESLITHFCHIMNLNEDDIEHRHAISGAISLLAQKSSPSDSASSGKEKPHITREDIVDALEPLLPSRAFVKAFEGLRKARNDMNHAGYTQGYKKAKAFQRSFHQLLEEFDKELDFFNQ